MLPRSQKILVAAAALFTLPGLSATVWPEVYPAPIGPDFGAVLDDGDAYLVHRSRVLLHYEKGKVKKARLAKLLGVRAPEPWLVRKQLQTGSLRDTVVRQRIFEHLDAHKRYGRVVSVEVAWLEQRLNKTSLELGSSRELLKESIRR